MVGEGEEGEEEGFRVDGRAMFLERFLSGSGRMEAGGIGREVEEVVVEVVEREGEGVGEDLRNSSRMV